VTRNSCLLYLLFCAAAPEVAAQDANGYRTLSQYHHTAWTRREGAPGGVYALAQTSDGFLWLGTSAGLYRFDGARFELYQPVAGAFPSQIIESLLPTPAGELWIGYSVGGVSRLHRGQLENFSAGPTLGPGSVRSLALQDGVVWAATVRGLSHFDGGRWVGATSAEGFDGTFVHRLLVDRAGTLWVATNEGVFKRPRGARAFARARDHTSLSTSTTFLFTGSRGSVWLSSQGGGIAPLIRPADPRDVDWRRPGPTGAALVDRYGGLWLGVPFGVEHVNPSSPRAVGSDGERLQRAQGLSGDLIYAMLEDREGNVWLGTPGGIDRFRRNKLTRVTLPSNLLYPAIAPANANGVWVGSSRDALMQIGGDRLRFPEARGIQTIYRDPDGTLWAASTDALWRRFGSTLTRLPLPRTVLGAQAITTDGAGGVWISLVRDSVYRVRGSTWIARGGIPSLPHDVATALYTDAASRTWFGYAGSRLLVLDGGTTRTFGSADGLDIGFVLAIHARDSAIWVGGERGLAMLAGQRFRSIVGADRSRFRGISGIVETEEGDLWLNGADGVTRIPAAEIGRLAADSAAGVAFERFDFNDGVEGTAVPLRPIPSLVRGDDGKLWFATENEVLWVDPRRVQRNALPPGVTVQALTADGRDAGAGAHLRLPKRTSSIAIDYTAQSLSIPERVRFRYRLIGSDDRWEDVGGRRQAYFTNLGPGEYTFQVRAANEDGVWNETGASLAFLIPPAFWQTTWFAALCVIAAALAGAVLYRLRLRQVARSLRARYSVALDERTRIAQELHDSLLQGFSGVTLQLEAVRRLIRGRPEEAESKLAAALMIADMTLRDARSTIWELRAPELEDGDLSRAVEVAARRLVGDAPIQLSVRVTGSRRPLDPLVETAVLRIAREAIANALKHGAPTRIEIELAYANQQLRVTIRDDGRGISPHDIEHAAVSGHWGIRGMRERAARHGGAVDVTRDPRRGSVVSLQLPVTGG
jgi:signal transduction histidine kinase/ligand-binding sensor domain-containing protein